MKLASPPFPEENDPWLIADWAELWAMTHASPLSMGKLKTTLARESQLDEAEAVDAWTELERRAKLFSPEWPLTLAQDVLAAKPDGDAVIFNYFMCALAFGYGIENEGRKIFEFCVRDVVRALIGHPALRLGAPRVPYRPLKDLVIDYCKQSIEKEGQPPPATDADLGLDIAGWLPFPDGRGGHVHFIGQCATGQNWVDKVTELNANKWRDHVQWAVPPVRFFAAPFVIREKDFRRVSQDAGLVLDRPRLLYLMGKAPLLPDTLKAVKDYCSTLYS